MNYGNKPVALPQNLIDSSMMPQQQKPAQQQPIKDNSDFGLSDDLKKIDYATKLEKLDDQRKLRFKNLLN